MSSKKLRRSSTPARYLGWAGEKAQPVHDTLVRLEWVGGSPSVEEWNNANFLLAETLRQKYESANLVHLEFRGIPDTESEYDILAEVAVRGPVRFHRIRVPSAEHRRKRRGRAASVLSAGMPAPFIPVPSILHDLGEPEKELLFRFNRLPLERRIRFWQEYVAPLCR